MEGENPAAEFSEKIEALRKSSEEIATDCEATLSGIATAMVALKEITSVTSDQESKIRTNLRNYLSLAFAPHPNMAALWVLSLLGG